MIDKIETVMMDFKGLKTIEEVKSYIPTQLIKYHPKPEMLIYDYVISGKGLNKKGLICYTLKFLIKDKAADELFHPLLLFKSLLKKDGYYIIIYTDRILEVEISNSLIMSCKQSDYNPIYIKDINRKDLNIICQEKHLKDVEKQFQKVLKLETLYKKCRKDLFVHRKESKTKPILLTVIPLLICSFFVYKGIGKYNKTINEMEFLEKQYNKIKESSSETSSIEEEYNELLQSLYIIKSQTNPDLYSLFYELNSYGSGYKIIDFNYSNRYLRVNALSTNSIELVKSLNRSPMLNLTQNSTTTNGSLEQVNFSGEVICP